MKAIGIIGSPRINGNTATLVKQILESYKETGGDTELIYLNSLDYKGCQGCGHCKIHNKCKLQDDLTNVLESMITADAIILGSPIYFGQFTGQMRLWLDRCYSLANPDFSPRIAPGKKAIIVGSQGMPDSKMYSSVFDEFAEILKKYISMEVVDVVVSAGYSEPGEVKKDIELMNKAKEDGIKLSK